MFCCKNREEARGANTYANHCNISSTVIPPQPQCLFKPELEDVWDVHEQSWRTSVLIFLAVSGLLSHQGRTASLYARETLTEQNKSQHPRAAKKKSRRRKQCSCICVHNKHTGRQFICVRTSADAKLKHSDKDVVLFFPYYCHRLLFLMN